eukprot:2123875-Pyramimonas_sp.AAC.1
MQAYSCPLACKVGFTRIRCANSVVHATPPRGKAGGGAACGWWGCALRGGGSFGGGGVLCAAEARRRRLVKGRLSASARQRCGARGCMVEGRSAQRMGGWADGRMDGWEEAVALVGG